MYILFSFNNCKKFNLIKFSESHLRTAITENTFNVHRVSLWRCGKILVSVMP